MADNKMIIDTNMFDINQHISVYSNGECIKKIDVKMDDISSVMKELSKEYDFSKISICGNREYLDKFTKVFFNSEFSNKKNVEVEYIEK